MTSAVYVFVIEQQTLIMSDIETKASRRECEKKVSLLFANKKFNNFFLLETFTSKLNHEWKTKTQIEWSNQCEMINKWEAVNGCIV